MPGHGEKLSRKQEQAIAALLACPTLGKAAEKAKVSERTLRTWLAQPVFQEAYRDARRRVVELSIGRLQQATSEAVGTLVKLLSCKHAGTRARAALGILQQSFGSLELADFMDRLKALERRIDEQAKRAPPA